MNTLISVIVPVYNCEKYLQRCIDSILNQTYRNIELILVNDGSTDSSGTICDEYTYIDDRVFVIHQKNSGSVNARKSGIGVSSGAYLGFVDADDWVESEMYEHLFSMMVDSKAEMVATGCIMEYDGYNYIDYLGIEGVYKRSASGINSNYKNMFARDLKSNMRLSSHLCDKLFQRKVIIKYFLSIPDSISFGEDLAFIYSSVPFMDTIYVMSQAYYHYNKTNRNSVTNNIKHNYIEDIATVYNYVKNCYKKHEMKEILIDQLDSWYIEYTITMLSRTSNINLVRYHFPIRKLGYNQSIIIYGAGSVGRSYCSQLKKTDGINIIGVIDKYNINISIGDFVVKNIRIIKEIEFDKIIIAVLNEDLSDKIRLELISEYDINKDKIIWERPNLFSDIIM